MSCGPGVRDVYEASGTALAPSEPLLLVVNRGTASASEVMAGSLSDNKRATIAGEKTFGKGLIQTIVPLSGGLGIWELSGFFLASFMHRDILVFVVHLVLLREPYLLTAHVFLQYPRVVTRLSLANLAIKCEAYLLDSIVLAVIARLG